VGLFSTKKTVQVSSSAYNLAGDINVRPDYLKTTILRGALDRDKRSMGDILTRSYLKGPGIGLRAFSSWARNSGYSTLVGQENSSLTLLGSLDHTALATAIPHATGEEVLIQSAVIGRADYTYWVDQYVATNYLSQLNTNYIADFNEATNMITITFVDGSVVSFTPSGYDPDKEYLYAAYVLSEEGIAGSITTGDTTVLGSGDSFPSTVGWTENSFTGDLAGDFSGEWEKTDYQGINPVTQSMNALRQIMYQSSAAGVRSYRIDTQPVQLRSWSPLQVLIYQRNNGNVAYDALFVSGTNKGDFLPYIPVRINNTFVSDSYMSDLYAPSKKAVRKAFGSSFDEIVSRLQDNPSLGDIDYAYIAFGAALNTKENAAKRYIYEFFQEIMLGQDLTATSYTAWRTAHLAAHTAMVNQEAWYYGQLGTENDEYGTPYPEAPSYPPPPFFEIQIASKTRADISYDMVISWMGMEETVGSGLKKPDAKVGELWFEFVGTEEFNETIWVGHWDEDEETGSYGTYPITSVDQIRLNWQTGINSWRSLNIYGLKHKNQIYGGRYVEITAKQALDDPEESGFIIPLHEEVLKRMPLKESTQLSTACSYLVLNSYQVVKQKWYASDWFRILLIVVIIIVAVYFAPAAGSTIGLLGTNAAVGAAVGLSGTAAIVAGAIINALAAMIVSQLLSVVSTSIFGDKVGSIVAIVASMILLNPGTLAGITDLATTLTNLLTAENLLKLTMAAGDGYSQILQAESQDILSRTQELANRYAEDLKLVTERSQEMFGTSSGVDLTSILLSEVLPVVFSEPPETFLSRTLLTGSEIADLSMASVTDFVDLTLNTNLPA